MANLAANDHLGRWLQVFNNSKVNGAAYLGDELPAYPWAWPTDTYLQRRLRTVRAETADMAIPANDSAALRRTDSAAISHFIESAQAGTLH